MGCVRSAWPTAALLVAISPGGNQISAQEIRTPDVDVLARTIVQELEVLRWHMGRPPELRLLIPVDGVTSRENFRQAMTLWRKVNQLGIECNVTTHRLRRW